MKEFYRKLVDLYAGAELPVELSDPMEIAAHLDSDLKQDMVSLKATVDALQTDPGPEFTEESYQRILTKIYTKVGAQPTFTESNPLQYQLPISV